MASPDARKVRSLSLDELSSRLDRCGGKHHDHLLTELHKRAGDTSQTSKAGKVKVTEAQRLLKAVLE